MSRFRPSMTRWPWRISSAEAASSSTASSRRLEPVARKKPAAEPVALEDIVFEADEEPRRAGVALPAGPAAELVVDAPALVAVGADDVEPAQGRDRSRSSSCGPPSLMSVPRPAMLVEMVTAPGAPAWAMIAASSSSFLALSTSQAMPARVERRGELLRFPDARRADQDRPARGVDAGDLRGRAPRCLASLWVKTTSGRSRRTQGRCGGTTTTPRP